MGTQSSRYRLTDAAREALSGDLNVISIGMGVRVRADSEDEDFIVPNSAVIELPPSIPDEPGPGMWDIGGRLALRPSGDTDDNHWRVFWAALDADDWFTWPEAWKECGGPDAEIRRLVPEPSTVDERDPVEFPLRMHAVYPPDLTHRACTVDEAQSPRYRAHVRIGEGEARVWLNAAQTERLRDALDQILAKPAVEGLVAEQQPGRGSS